MALCIVFAIFAILICIWAYLSTKRPRNFAPGPSALPIFGTMHLTKDIPHIVLSEFSKKYGSMIGIKFGNRWSLWLHDTKLVREAFSDLNITGRYSPEATSYILGDEYGILQAHGDTWTEQRRFGLRTLREFGFGKTTMEVMILDEATELCDWLKKTQGEPIKLKRRLSLAVVNSLWRILTGERYEHDDAALSDILDKLDSSQEIAFGSRSPLKMLLMFFYPSIAKFFAHFSGWKQLVESATTRNELFRRIITDHGNSLDANSPRDFVDLHLLESLKTKDASSSFHPTVAKRSLQSVISDLFFAGSDTTSTTLNWTFVYLLHYPNIQEKIQNEIDAVIGQSKKPSLSDRKRLIYTEAFIMEVLRHSSILPVGVNHMILEDTTFHGYSLPKGTIVVANIYHIHRDPEVWGDPEEFRPERFLSPDGTSILRYDAFIPFSVGRRICIGEGLAKDSLFLFLTSILQSFTISLPSGQALPPLDADNSKITLQPKSFEVVVKSRYLVN